MGHKNSPLQNLADFAMSNPAFAYQCEAIFWVKIPFYTIIVRLVPMIEDLVF
jgi:hypothetical protein